MLRKSITGLVLAGLLMGMALSAAAGEVRGALDVNLRRKGTPIEGSTVALCFAGVPVPEGYRLEADFGGGIIRQEDVFSPELARWMAQRGSARQEQVTDGEGRASFRDLGLGLYLVMQEEAAPGYQRMEPFLAVLSEELSYIDTYPAMDPAPQPKTSDTGSPGAAGLSMLFSGLGLLVLLRRRKTV